MPWQPLPITGPAFRTTDESELDTRNAYLMDVLVNDLGDTVKRPCLEPWVDLGTTSGVDGLYWWDEQNVLMAVTNGHTLKVTTANGDFVAMGGVQVPIGNRVSWDTNGTQLIYSNGGQMVITTVNGTPVAVSDADAPMQVPYVMIHDQYAIATIKDTSTFQISEVGELDQWRAQDIFSAESKPDIILAGSVSKDGVFLYGPRSTEFWINDGVTPFSRVRGLSLDRGIGAAYSLAQWGDERFWLDEKRQPVRATLQGVTEIDNPYLRDFQALISVQDAVGEVMVVDGWPLWVLSFPLANRTFVYNIKQNDWSEWGQWDTENAVYRRFIGHTYAYAKAWGFHVVGDYRNGMLYKLTRGVYRDNDEDIVRSVRRTGYITHGTANMKRANTIRLRLKKGVANATVSSPVMMVRWRNKGGAWSALREVSLGEVGQHEVFVELRNLGMYRARQYEFIHTDNSDWILADGQENVDVMLH